MTSIQIFIKTLRGKTITLDVNPRKDTILSIKNKICELEGITPAQQMLTYCGKKLSSKYSLKFYKISQYCSLDLSLKLLSSPTTITVKLAGDNNKDKHIHFTSFTTLQNIKETIQDPSSIITDTLPVIKSFVHNNILLRNDNLRITEIDSVWSDLTLHTKYGTPFEESISIEYIIKHNEHQIHRITQPLSYSDFEIPIANLIYKSLRKTNIHPLYYSGYCPFKQLTICYNNINQQLRLDDASEFAQPFKSGNNKYLSLQKCRSEEFGLLPQTQLKHLKLYFPKCDCCPLTTIQSDDADGYVVASHSSNGWLDVNIISIQAEISDISFILHNKFYCINGRFYKKYDAMLNKNKINMHLYPVIGSPQKLNEELLMYGYVRNKTKKYKLIVPIDVIKLIIIFYPAMYGAHYDISKHNPDLHNQLKQKTNVFVIDDIKFYLKYGDQREGNDEENYFSDKSEYYLVLDFSKQKTIFSVFVLCSIYCKISKQSYTFIRDVDPDASNYNFIQLIDFGFVTSLSTLVCDVQIVGMIKGLKATDVYEYPAMLRQNAYLLEWNIHEKLVTQFKYGINNKTSEMFESEIFYDLFKLRCYPNEKNCLFLSIQLLALPVNRPNKEKISGLKTRCQIYETETHSQIPAFEAIFDYSEDNSAFTILLMKSEKINDVKTLRFRVEIVIIDENNQQYYSMENNENERFHFVRNLHDGNAKRGIREDRGRVRRRPPRRS
eukprot:526222_1